MPDLAGNMFVDNIQIVPCEKIKLRILQRQTAVTVYLQSERLLLFAIAWLSQINRRPRLSLETQRYWVQIPAGSNVCHRSFAYTVLQTVQRPGVCSAVYGTKHYYEPYIRIGLSHDFGLPSVAILP